MTHAIGVTEVVLRDGHQSLLATRMRTEDMLPIARQLDQIGYWSVESWGGATFDACLRYLNEDPWERLRLIKANMPNTRQQMLLRGQNLLGYRHYADDLVERFIARACACGIEVFRIFDAMNDVRNLRCSVAAALKYGAHAQGTLCYTTSPVHTLAGWVDLAKGLEDLGCHSLCIKDMAGLLRPYEAAELVLAIKSSVKLPLALHCHATTGLSLATQIKAIEAGVDMVDTAISSMSMTYGHSPTESVVAMLQGTPHDTGLDLEQLAGIADYFRDVRKRYASHEGSLKGVDARILLAQVPGGMLTNMESQLKEQNALALFDEVLAEIPRVRADLGYIPLVTPTSQIVGTQAVLNILAGERYKSITKEVAALLRGEYGAAPAPYAPALLARVLNGTEPLTVRPADLLPPEWSAMQERLAQALAEAGMARASLSDEAVLIYAMFPQIGLDFLLGKQQPAADMAKVATSSEQPAQKPGSGAGPARYQVRVNGHPYLVEILDEEGKTTPLITPEPAIAEGERSVEAPLSGAITRICVEPGARVSEGTLLLVMEVMKMEAEIRAPAAGIIKTVHVQTGQQVKQGMLLISMAG